MQWSDGKPFTSADPLWTFNAVLENKTNQLHGGVEALKSVSAPDKYTFVMHLATRDSEFLEKLAVPVLPAHAWSKYPVAKLDKVDGPIPTVTTAPYQLTKWEKNGTTILTRNEQYDVARNGGKLPAVKRILITYYANPDSVYRDVNQGNLDYGYGGPDELGPARQEGRQRERQARLLAARRLLGDRVQLVPADRIGHLQRARARASRPPSCRIPRSARPSRTRSIARS